MAHIMQRFWCQFVDQAIASGDYTVPEGSSVEDVYASLEWVVNPRPPILDVADLVAVADLLAARDDYRRLAFPGDHDEGAQA